jgi:hypothetical protein
MGRQLTLPSGLAENFATTVLCLKHGLSSSIVFGCSGMGELFLQNPAKSTSGSAGPTEIGAGLGRNAEAASMGFDMHNTGRAVSIMTCGYLYHCINAMLNHMIEQVGVAVWENTVVSVTAEFDRNPRDPGVSIPNAQINPANAQGGADHAWNGRSGTILVGSNRNFMVAGAIDPDPSSNSSDWEKFYLGKLYKGSWGASGNLNVDGGVHLANLGNMTSTIASFLNVEAPLSNFQPMIRPNGNRADALVEYVMRPYRRAA